ncbi:MAG: hypothetical protein RSB44_10820 [Carnobacterium sp.]
MKDIRLTDGSLLEIGINFYTLKLINDLRLVKLFEKYDKDRENDDLILEICGKLIFVILRSNGKKVDEEEAMILVPPDDEEINNLINQFMEKLEKFKKKQENKMKAPK